MKKITILPFLIIFLLVTGTAGTAFAVHEHTPDDDSVTTGKILDGEILAADTDAAANFAFTDSAETITGVYTFGTSGDVGKLRIFSGVDAQGITILDSSVVETTKTLTLPDRTDFLVSRTSPDTLTFKTIDARFLFVKD